MGEKEHTGAVTVRIIATIEQVPGRASVLVGPLAEALITAGAHTRISMFEADEDIDPYERPYQLACPLCDGDVVAVPVLELVIIECIGQCKRAWQAPRRKSLMAHNAAEKA